MSTPLLVWDKTGEKQYETGVKQCVLYPQDETGAYPKGVAWNGITGITESPSGADTTSLYANDAKYINLVAAEEFGGTITAYMYPDEWAACDGSAELVSGVSIGQQDRKNFGLCYKTTVGNDAIGNAYGYKLHIVYGGTASPSDKDYQTINDSPEAMELSWEFSTVPVPVEGHKPTATVTIDATKLTTEAQKKALADLEEILYGKAAGEGTEAVQARLPLPKEIAEIFTAA